MSRAVYHIGHTLDVVRSLPDASVDLVLTSPPFLALRSYLPADDPAKVHEIGQEATPASFVDTLLALSAEWRRVLAPHGSIAIELGDTYSGAKGWGDQKGTERYPNGRGMDTPTRAQPTGPGWPLAKSLALVPELYRIGLAYGLNPLTGQPSPAGRWRVRNVVRWHRPNPPVGALSDKYRPATTDMVVACTSDKRWFDLDAVRERPKSGEPGEQLAASRENIGYSGRDKPGAPGASTQPHLVSNPAGAPPLDTWIIPTEAYSGAHYATWPRALCVRPIESMCPRRVCKVCGEPSRRIVEVTQSVITYGHYSNKDRPGQRSETKTGNFKGRRQDESDVNEKPSHHQGFVRHAETLGWTDCGHDAWRNGVVLDPFAGSGTTLAVATGCGRDAIGIDLDIRNADLARDRIGMFMEIA